MPVSNSTLSRASLEDTARKICESRGGKWSGSRGMACCPAHDDRTPSLGVSLGQKAVLFHCFAGCDQQSVLAALAREGFETPAFFSASATTNGSEPTRTRKPSAAALRIWRDAQPLRASPAKAYLESRGILAASPALRFHPRTPLGPKGRTRFLPAMIAAVSLDEGPIAIHRTFLSGNAKADFDKPKRALGALGEAAVRLFAPASGKLGLAEGIESAMSAYALAGIPTWATLGNERFGLVSVPESVTELHLFVDHDAGGELAASRGLAAYTPPPASIACQSASPSLVRLQRIARWSDRWRRLQRQHQPQQMRSTWSIRSSSNPRRCLNRQAST